MSTIFNFLVSEPVQFAYCYLVVKVLHLDELAAIIGGKIPVLNKLPWFNRA